MKRILFVFPTLKPGGAEIVAVNIANYLIQKGAYHITLFVYDNSTYLRGTIHPDIHIVQGKRNVNTSSTLSIWYHYYLRFGWSLFLYCRKNTFEHIVGIHEQVPEIAIAVTKAFLWLFSINRQCRFTSIIATNIEAVRENRNHWSSRLILFVLSKIRKYIFSTLIVITERMKVHLQGQSRTIVKIPNPIHIDILQSIAAEKEPESVVNEGYIIFVARVTRQKNHLLLFRAFLSIRDKVKFNILCIGEVYDADFLNELQNYIIENNLTERISIRGTVEHPHRYISNAKAIVLVSDYEGVPVSLLEAMAMKVPVVTTQFDGHEEYFTESNAVLIQRQSQHSLEDALVKVEQRGEELSVKARRAYEDCQLFDISVIGEQYHSFFSGPSH